MCHYSHSMRLQMSSPQKRTMEPYPYRFTPSPLFSSKNHPISPLESALATYSVSVDFKRFTIAKFYSQPLYLQHLQASSITVANRHLISLLKSALTGRVSATLLESTLAKKMGGGAAPIHFPSEFLPNYSVGSTHPLNMVDAGHRPQATGRRSPATGHRQ